MTQRPSYLTIKEAEWWRTAVIYQIYPRSFFDSNGDGIGDIPGIEQKLDYIASLGVDAIWISPFVESPMKDFGYDVSDYRKVDPIFGTNEQFKSLIDKAHARGLKIIIDKVVSHTSDQHPWFKESRKDKTNPKSDWYVWVDPKPDGTCPTNWLSVFGGSAWQWDSVRRQYYLHNFLDSQPDLNYHNEEVQLQVIEEFRFWLDMGVDGFRLDTVNYYYHDDQLRDNPPLADRTSPRFMGGEGNPYEYQEHIYDKNRPENLGWLERLRTLMDQYDARMLVGEVGDSDAEQMMGEYTQGNNRLHMAYSFQFLQNQNSPEFVADSINKLETEILNGWPAWALSNHDCIRVGTRWVDEQYDIATQQKFFMTLLICLRGSICIYNGEELGYTEAELEFHQLQDPYGINFWPDFKGRDGCRTPIAWTSDDKSGGFTAAEPWLPVASDHIKNSIASQENNSDSMLQFSREILKWRKQYPQLLLGSIKDIKTNNGVLSFIRTYHGLGDLHCYFNFGTKPVDIEIKKQGETIYVPGQRSEVSHGTLQLEGFSMACIK